MALDFLTAQAYILQELTFFKEMFSEAEKRLENIPRTHLRFITDCDALQHFEAIASTLKSIQDTQNLLETKIRNASPQRKKYDVESLPLDEDKIKVESDALDPNNVEFCLEVEDVDLADIEALSNEETEMDIVCEPTNNASPSKSNEASTLTNYDFDHGKKSNLAAESKLQPSSDTRPDNKSLLQSELKRLRKSNRLDIYFNKLSTSICGNKEVKIVLERLKDSTLSNYQFPEKSSHLTILTCEFCDRKFNRKGLQQRHRCFARDKKLKLGQTYSGKPYGSKSKSSTIKAIAAAIKRRRRRKVKPSKVAEEETDPLVHCPDCNEDVIAKNFKIHAEERHGYSNLLNFKLIFPTFTVPLECSKCGKWFTTDKKYNYHQRTKCGTVKPKSKIILEVAAKERSGYYLENNDDPVECYACKEMVLPKDIKEHYETSHGKVIEVNTPSSSKQKIVIKECLKCGKKMPSTRMIGHLRRDCQTLKDQRRQKEAESKKYVDCPVCHKRVESNYYKFVHKLLHDEGEKKYHCTYCPKRFVNRSILNFHITFQHSGKKFVCDVCGKEAKTSFNLKVHMRIHSEDKPFKCDQCDSSYKYKNSLSTHKESMHSERSYQCGDCGMMFSTSAALKRHVEAVHEGIRPYACHLCDKKFKTQGNLKYHVNTHANPNSRKRGYNKEKQLV